jgi:hypothetical protein
MFRTNRQVLEDIDRIQRRAVIIFGTREDLIEWDAGTEQARLAQFPPASDPLGLKAASLQGLPNELQLKIIHELINPKSAYGENDGHKDRTLQTLWTFREDHMRSLRCVVLGLLRVLPHFRPYLLGILRVRLMIREYDQRRIKKGEMRFQHEWLYYVVQSELTMLKMLVVYLQSGDIEKLKTQKELDRGWDPFQEACNAISMALINTVTLGWLL